MDSDDAAQKFEDAVAALLTEWRALGPNPFGPSTLAEMNHGQPNALQTDNGTVERIEAIEVMARHAYPDESTSPDFEVFQQFEAANRKRDTEPTDYERWRQVTLSSLPGLIEFVAQIGRA